MKLIFIRGGGLRRVFIKKRIITLVTAEFNFQPFEINLDKIDEKEMFKKKLTKEEIITIRDLSTLGSEKEIAKDIIKDFQRIGWRLYKKQ